MAWFNPPLTKPGNHRCPRCGESRNAFWGWHGGQSEWCCPRCRSVLKWEKPRHYVSVLIGFLVNCGGVLAIVFMQHRPVHASDLAMLVAVVAAGIVIDVFVFWWMSSISLVEEPATSPSAPNKPSGTT